MLLFLGKTELNIGLFLDQHHLAESARAEGGGYLGLLSFPIVNQLDGSILFHKDINIVGENSTLLSLGLKLKL